MIPQMEKTYPAGVNNEGKRSEISPVVWPFKGRPVASPLTAMVPSVATITANWRQ
jgi:hypothetical protein